MRQITKAASFFTFPLIVFLTHIFSYTVLDLYTFFPNLDIPFHFTGGFSIAYTSAKIPAHLEKETVITKPNRAVFLALILSLTATATVFWEFGEFIMDRVLGTNIQVSVANTMQEQFMVIAGGITWALIYRGKNPGKMSSLHLRDLLGS
jgi:hypothetical protein